MKQYLPALSCRRKTMSAPFPQIEQCYQRKLVGFRKGITFPYSLRKQLLKDLYRGIQKHEESLLKALNEDLGKSEFEAFSNEIGIVYKEISHSLKHLRRWMRAKRVYPPDLHLLPGKARILREPYGVSLIIAPWNYPVQLLLSPMIGALAGGNTIILKPSELAPACSKALTDMIHDTFSDEIAEVINGGPEETTALLNLPVDHIFFTGSVPVGKIVMTQAAKRLTPVTLELGGKSPAIITPSAKLDTAARRIAWGKYNNTGQTCVAPDYVLVHRSIYQDFVNHLKSTVQQFYGEDPKSNSDLGRIINQRHFDRLSALMTREDLLFGGERDAEDLYIAPSAYGPVDWEHPLMEDEIFGPLLPIMVYEDLDQAIAMVRERPKPLALYVFSEDSHEIREVTTRISFGGGGINTTVLHVASSKLPFGGVGPSGMGDYHGEASFRAFTHQKSLLSQPAWPDMGLTYPHKKISLKLIRKVLR